MAFRERVRQKVRERELAKAKGSIGTSGAPRLEKLADIAEMDGHERTASEETPQEPSTEIVRLNTKVQPRYFLLLEIDGLLLNHHYGFVGKTKDNLGLTKKAKLHIWRRPGLLQFLEFCLSRFEVFFWSTLQDDRLEDLYEELCKTSPALGLNRKRFGRRWCDKSKEVYPSKGGPRPVYLKRLARILTHKGALGREAYWNLKDYFLIVDPIARCNILNDPYCAYHPDLFEKSPEKTIADTPDRPYLVHVVQPFLQGLLDSGNTVPQYCAQHSFQGWRRLLPGDEDHTKYREVISEDAAGFDVPCEADPWVIPVPGLNKYTIAPSVSSAI